MNWTYSKKLKLYKALVDNFGPYKNWKTIYTPQNKEEEYKKFCINIAKTLGMSSPAEVAIELSWVLNRNDMMYKKHVRIWLESECAAMITGFIDESHMPIEIGCKY